VFFLFIGETEQLASVPDKFGTLRLL